MTLRRVLGVAMMATVTGATAVAGLGAAAPAASAASGPATASHHPALSWQLLNTGTTEHFRGLSAVNRKVAWLGGYDGTVLRTTDSGRTWRNVSPAGASTLQFRDIQAFSARRAVAMAAGTGTDSRLYVTANGGKSWQLAYQNTNADAFFDCMSFFTARHGLVLSDPVNGKFRILSTRNGGRSWRIMPRAGMPPALSGEAGFAAGGECLTASGRHNAWFGSGGGSVARIFHSRNGGRTWHVASTPMTVSASAGVFALAFRSPAAGVATGGDFSSPSADTNIAALSYFGSHWFTPPAGPAGYRSGLTWVPHTPASLIAVGLTGSDISYDGGLHWHTFDTGQFDTVTCTHDGACWASGDLGRVAILHR
jgi:photosystem II stability/assembly factor-like uncharacterized protein